MTAEASAATMRGQGFESVLAAQRHYAGQAGRAKFGLMVPEAFVRGIRDLGYRSNGDAIAEFIDNSFQAYAERVDVVFGYNEGSLKKPTMLAVIDDGHGMEPAMIRMAVMWGGTHREGDRSGLGRYGYGLPCASVSLGRRFTVYSQIAGGALYAVTLDLDELVKGAYTDTTGDIIVPEPQRADLPPFVASQIAANYPAGWTSGTVILIEKPDRLEWATTQGLRENLSRQFGVTYHKLRGEAAIFVDDVYVEPIDPLFLTPQFHLHDLDGDRAHGLDQLRIEVRDPGSGEYLGAISLRYAWLPPSFGSVDKARDAVGLNANPRFSILKDYHGLIFSRNGRLIDVQTRTPWTTFINNDRYIKVEVEFSASLDEAFGVTTSKQQVTVSSFIWDRLREAGLPKAIEQLRSKVREAKLERRLAAFAPAAGELRLSERVMSQANLFGRDLPLQMRGDNRVSPYHVAYERVPGGAFFRVEQKGDHRILHLNTEHRFYEDIYDAPASTAEVRSSLEILLFTFGDGIIDGDTEAFSNYSQQIDSWSRRLELALSMVASHLAESEDVDVGPLAWGDDSG